MVKPFIWKFIWKNSPIGEDQFSLHVQDVYDVPDVPYYYVTILVTDKIVLSDFKDYFFTEEIIDWEDLCQPWRKFEHYSYQTD